MFYHVNQPGTSSFPSGLVKTESNFVVRSFETVLGRIIVVVTVINVVAYTFFGFFRSDLSP